MGVRDRFMAGLARQLGKPDGVRGRLVGIGLNRGNRGTVAAAVGAASLRLGAAAADVGFGGGVGLQLLLDQVGAGGHVDGVDLSDTMVQAAERRYRAACSDRRLTLHHGDMGALPLDDSSLDGLISVNTIYFVDDLPTAFAEVARVLRPQGRAVIGLADPEAMASMPFTAHGFRLRPVSEVMQALRQAGLSDIRHERVGDADRSFHLLVAGNARPRGEEL